MKVTDTAIANFFGLTKQTICNYKNSDEKKYLMQYKALRSFYINEHNQDSDAKVKINDSLKKLSSLINDI